MQGLVAAQAIPRLCLDLCPTPPSPAQAVRRLCPDLCPSPPSPAQAIKRLCLDLCPSPPSPAQAVRRLCPDLVLLTTICALAWNTGALGAERPAVPRLRRAPEIHKWCYRFQDLPPDQPDFFIDAGGQISPALEVWVKENATRFRKGTALRPLLITGLIKVGALGNTFYTCQPVQPSASYLFCLSCYLLPCVCRRASRSR